jgi:hypothetical protein
MFRDFSLKPAWHRLLNASLCTFAVFLVLGCGEESTELSKPFFPVKGKILLPDGKPLTSGHVAFLGRSGLTGLGTIGSDGAFEIKGTKDGLPEGVYRIRIDLDPVGTPKGKKSSARAKGAFPVAAKYLDEDGSDLEVTVTPDSGSKDITITLTK